MLPPDDHNHRLLRIGLLSFNLIRIRYLQNRYINPTNRLSDRSDSDKLSFQIYLIKIRVIVFFILLFRQKLYFI